MNWLSPIYSFIPRGHSPLIPADWYRRANSPRRASSFSFINSNNNKIMTDHFLYFAYGSNLSEKRLHLQNPSATFQATAKLKDRRLAFQFTSSRWKGDVANIECLTGSAVWGVLWKLHKDHLPTLDDQEGVEQKIYRRITVGVTTDAGENVECYTYELVSPGPSGKPSPKYKQVIVNGAKEHKLPSNYIADLEAIQDNGYDGDYPPLIEDLGSFKQ